MKISALVLCFLQFALVTATLAKAPHPNAVPVRADRRLPASADTTRRGPILRQDLFDRGNPNNLRSDYPSPPAQPGQF
jgi:hypothetical protein